MRRINGIIKHWTVLFAAGTFSAGCFYLVAMLRGYSFIPKNGLALHLFSIALLVVFTLVDLITRKEKSKASLLCAALLPALALFLLATKGCVFQFGGKGSGAFIVFIFLFCLGSLAVFFFGMARVSVKIVLGSIYSVLMMLILLLMVLILPFRDFGAVKVVKSRMSPNDLYLAEIIDSDQGALGGDTLVNVTDISRSIDLFFGVLQKNPMRIYTGDWGEFDTMVLQWETDHILYINGERYTVE